MTIDKDLKNDINLEIIFENQNWLILNKPAGLLVHPTKYERENTLVDWLIKKYPAISAVGGSAFGGKNVSQPERPGIVHRLDKEVSGLMLVAKTQSAYDYFVQQFQNNQIQKEYLALVYGRPPAEKGIIDLPLGRNKKGRVVAVQYHKDIKFEKPAQTQYEIVKKYPEYTLLKIQPLTGRTHQIRVHLKSIGCPIVGDHLYAHKKLIQKTEQLKRIFLHAYHLRFNDQNGQPQEFEISLTQDLQSFLNKEVN